MNAGMPADSVTADLQKTVELDPVNPWALFWLSRMVGDNKPDEARELLERSSTFSDLFALPWIYYNLAQLENSLPDTFFHLNGDMESNRNQEVCI